MSAARGPAADIEQRVRVGSQSPSLDEPRGSDHEQDASSPEVGALHCESMAHVVIGTAPGSFTHAVADQCGLKSTATGKHVLSVVNQLLTPQTQLSFVAREEVVVRRPSKKKATKAKRPVKAKPATKAKPRSKTKEAAKNWSTSKFAFWSQRWSTNNASTSVLLRHPTAPFPPGGLLVDAIDDETIQEIGLNYLLAVSQNQNIDPPLNLPQSWISALQRPGSNSAFAWLPIGWPPKEPDGADAGNPFVSFQAGRFEADGEPLPDQTVILFASEWVNTGDGRVVAGSDFGIRIVVHALQQNGRYQIRITGMTASLPSGYYLTDGLSTAPMHSLVDIFSIANDPFLVIKAGMAKTLRVPRDNISLRGVRMAKVEDAVKVEWRGTSGPAIRDGYTPTTPYSFVFLGTDTDAGALVSKVELVADAAGDAKVFPLDPASQAQAAPVPIHARRPSRNERWLDPFRFSETISTTILPGQLVQLVLPSNAPLPSAEMGVVVCPGFVVADDPPVAAGSVKEVNLPGAAPNTPHALSNDLSAISAYNNVREFFKRLTAYGLGAYPYFRLTQMPLKLFYRSGIRPGPEKDGQTVNARILVEGFNPDFVGTIPAGQRPILEMHLALADLSTRKRKPWNGVDRSQAEPLGIAADARWIWHEIGHVLLAASVGELEFRFAHSAGDALAAIVADPQSALAKDPNWRGATFPWVFTPRRHDRCVLHGWGWGGALHYPMSQVPDSTPPRRKGYWSEQIMSSSLFRLYRCIGGDTKMLGPPGGPGETTRESASHYSTFLIMRGIQLLGTSGVTLANEPDQFVTALMDADQGVGAWNVSWVLQWDVLYAPPPPQPVQFQFNRVGGCVWKVIRWAFEAQGLYADAGQITNAPGHAPPVDVYIRDSRPTTEATPYGPIEYGPGSYIPVSLDWGPATPLWQADPANGIVVAAGNISVTVGNRGSQQAMNVQVSVWWCAWPANTAPPRWGDPLTPWTPCNPQPSVPKNIAAGAQTSFGPFAFAPPGGARYLVLAQATCADDKANIDPTTMLACSHMPTALLDLVPNDNNLGLLVVAV
jgi:hypothetical protein